MLLKVFFILHSFHIPIPALPEDTTPPLVTFCPNDIEETASPGTNSAYVTWTEPRATDDSGVTPLFFKNYESGMFFDVGSTLVEYRILDNAGNVATCSFVVTVSGKLLVLCNSLPPRPRVDLAPTPSFFSERVCEIQNCLILGSYLDSAWKMHQHEYKQAYAWSSGS